MRWPEVAEAARTPVGHHGQVRPDPSAGDLPDLPVVPDDASSLERDVEALRRERRALARSRRVRRLLRGRSGAGLGGPVVAAALLVVALVATLPVLLRPALDADPRARPLAAPSVPPGRVGGLLPDVTLETPVGDLAARDVARPGVLELVPTRCGCDAAVREAVDQAREYTRNIRLVTDGRVAGAAQEADRLRVDVSRGLARSAQDPLGALATAFRARGVTLVLLRADGVVLDVLPDVQPGERLEQRLTVLRAPV